VWEPVVNFSLQAVTPHPGNLNPKRQGFVQKVTWRVPVRDTVDQALELPMEGKN